MSSFILKLLDETVLPAVLVFCVKVGGLILLARFFNVSFSIQNGRLTFGRFVDLVWINDLSNLLLILAILLGTGWVILRLNFFHESHLHPSLLSRLLEFDLEFAVSTSFNLFHQAFVWLSLGFLFLAALLIQFLFGLSSPLIFILALIQEIFLAVLVIADFEREVRIAKNDQPSLWISETEVEI